MSTDYRIACFTCKKEGPIFASGSIAYGYKVWCGDPELLKWLGHRESCGHHEGHDLRILSEQCDLPWEDEATHPPLSPASEPGRKPEASGT